jgi:RimJ/RimL family protein N-acetyltransferase
MLRKPTQDGACRIAGHTPYFRMDTHFPETFGAPGQQAMQSRTWSAWQLLGDDPQYCTHGRAVALADPTDDNIARQIALARLVGAAACEHVPTADLDARGAALMAAGLVTDSFVMWTSGAQTLDRARARLAERPLPGDLTLEWIDADTPPGRMAALDAVTQSCEVLLPLGPFIRGVERPALCVMAVEPSGRAVGAAASVLQFHPASAHPGFCWWGMLSTHPDRRGEGIASRLGAEVLTAMADRLGFTRFFTGIRTGNAASEALCAALDFGPTDTHALLAIDPEVIGGGRVTK